MKTYDRFDDKKILIWGYGREGKSTEGFLRSFCHPASVEVFEGAREDINEEEYDYIIKSPGIVMEDDDPRFSSQTQIFLETFRDNTIGITGTKGKSTTSAMLYHVLCNAGKKAVFLGNIGEPCLDHFSSIDDDTIVVFEMSCHQLAHVTVSPHIAIFLNLFEEHLDYYKTLDRYFDAKANIARFQGPSDHLFVKKGIDDLKGEAKRHIIDINNVPRYDLSILGHHNDINAHFVHEVASVIYGIDDKVIRAALSEFRGLPHRLQHVGCIDGVDCYDDSISTIPSATIEAIGAVKNAGTILIGGMDRGISYDDLVEFIEHNPGYDYIFSYDSGKRIYDSTSKGDNCHYCADLKEAVALAKRITPKGRAIILSPASASYGYFKNFEERGEVFCSLLGQSTDTTS